MTIGPASILALLAAGLATVVWFVATRVSLPAWLCLFLFGFALVLVQTAGPLVRLP